MLHSVEAASDNNVFVQGALKEMKEVELVLGEELAKHFSLQVTDLDAAVSSHTVLLWLVYSRTTDRF